MWAPLRGDNDHGKGDRSQHADRQGCGRDGRLSHAPCRYGFVTSKTRFFGDGPNDAHVTTGVWFTPGFDQSQTPAGKILRSRASSRWRERDS